MTEPLKPRIDFDGPLGGRSIILNPGHKVYL